MAVHSRLRVSVPDAPFVSAARFISVARFVSAARFVCVVLFVSTYVLPCFAQSTPVQRPIVLDKHPHDPSAFTQGLLVDGGDFYESTGRYGESTLRQVDIESGTVLRSVALADTDFGEGLARVGNRLIQLTWQEHVAYVYSIDDFAVQQTFAYDGEGWGLCFDGEVLVMSDGSSQLFFRDPATFEELSEVTVTLDGEPVTMLNELECVAGQVFANVWQTDRILQIDPKDGSVLRVIDASGLLTSEEAAPADVLNGIAYDSERRHFFITGKLWPWMFEVVFDPPGSGSDRPRGCGCSLGRRDASTPEGAWLFLVGAVCCRRRVRRRRPRGGPRAASRRRAGLR